MGWQDILKIKINSLTDATRVARDYAPNDWLEGHLLTQEEYDKLSTEQRVKYHTGIYNKYKNLGLKDEREAKWHNNNRSRILSNTGNAILKPHPTEEEDFKPIKQGAPKRPDSYKNILQGTGRRVYGPRTASRAKQLGYRIPKELQRKRGPKIGSKNRRKLNRRKPKVNPIYNPIKQIIIDYFTLYNRKFGRNPTLQDIANEEDRPLTVDEIESFKRYSQGR